MKNSNCNYCDEEAIKTFRTIDNKRVIRLCKKHEWLFLFDEEFRNKNNIGGLENGRTDGEKI